MNTPVRLRNLVALAATVALGGLTAAQQLTVERGGRQLPAFRAGVDVVSLNVTVTDSSGRYITDLQKEEFLVFEDGVQQEVTFFSKTPLPIALALLLDTSASMEEKLATAREAAIGFVRRLRPEDTAMVIDFNSRVNVRQGFTNDRAALEAAIRSTSAAGSTSLYNAIYISLKELKKFPTVTAEALRRHAVVLLSDGEDTSSLLSFDEVLDLARRSETAIYTIGLRGRESVQGRGFQEADFVLRQLAQETGGRAFFPSSMAELGRIYDQISEELASQYTLGYSSKNPRRDGQWRRIVVRVARQNAVARTKQGYFAPTSN
jgi:Ca-activated chloride channel family protein